MKRGGFWSLLMLRSILNYMWYVYVDWTVGEDSYPFYVGQGNAGRVRQLKRNRYHTGISSKYGCERKIVLETSNREEALAEEIRLIAELKTFYGDNPNGANFTRGGDGGHGVNRRQVSEETRRKLAAAARGRVPTPESNRKRREAQLGKKKDRRPFTEEEKERLYAGRRGRGSLTSPEANESRRQKLTGRKRPAFSEEWKQKLSEAAKRRCREKPRGQTEESKKKAAEKMKRYWEQRRAREAQEAQAKEEQGAS